MFFINKLYGLGQFMTKNVCQELAYWKILMEVMDLSLCIVLVKLLFSLLAFYIYSFELWYIVID